MTSITLAQVDDIVMRFSKATFRWSELFKSIIILSIENMKSITSLLGKDIPKGTNLFSQLCRTSSDFSILQVYLNLLHLTWTLDKRTKDNSFFVSGIVAQDSNKRKFDTHRKWWNERNYSWTVFQRLKENGVILMDMDSKLSSASITWEVPDPDCPGVEVYQSTKNARRDMLKNLCIITKAWKRYIHDNINLYSYFL